MPSDAGTYRTHSIKVFNNLFSPPVATSSSSSANLSDASRVLNEQRADTAAAFEADFVRQTKRPPSAALSRAIAGRPDPATVARLQHSARVRENDERQRQVAAKEAERLKNTAAQLEAARVGHKRAVASLRERQAKNAQVAAKVDAHREAAAEKQQQRMAALEQSTAAALGEMRSERDRRVEKRAAWAARREAERAELTEQGYNPYLVQRQRDEASRRAREAKREQAEQAAKMADAKVAIAAKLQRERAMREAQRKAKAEARPLPHVNVEVPGGPRTLCEASCIELG